MQDDRFNQNISEQMPLDALHRATAGVFISRERIDVFALDPQRPISRKLQASLREECILALLRLVFSEQSENVIVITNHPDDRFLVRLRLQPILEKAPC